MNTSWVWDFISDIVFLGIGLGLLGLIIYYGLSSFFWWLAGCDRKDESDGKKENEK